jgi:hypothetical protein
MPGELRYWRERERDDTCLLAARYGAHVWERHVHEELVLSISEGGTGVCETKDGVERGGPGTFWIFAPGEAHEGFVEDDWQYRGAYLGERSLCELAGAFDADRVRTLRFRRDSTATPRSRACCSTRTAARRATRRCSRGNQPGRSRSARSSRATGGRAHAFPKRTSLRAVCASRASISRRTTATTSRSTT